MPEPYSLDLRQKVLLALDSGMSKVEASRVFNIGRKTLYRWLQRQQDLGHCRPKTQYQRGHSHKITDLDEFRTFVHVHQGKTQQEMAALLGVSASTVSKTLRQINFTRKKRLAPTMKVVNKSDKSL